MYNFSYENQGINTYLVYTVSGEAMMDSMSLGMITNNKIAGLAPTLFMQMNDTKYVKYNISSKIPAKQLLMGTVNRKRLIGVFKGIVDAMMSAEDYMLDMNMIVLDPDYIFTDVSTCDTVLIYLPIANLEGNVVDFKSFFRNIMFTTQFDQTENCDYVAKIINYINSSAVFVPEAFRKLLDEIGGAQGGGIQGVMRYEGQKVSNQKPQVQPVPSTTPVAQDPAPQRAEARQTPPPSRQQVQAQPQPSSGPKQQPTPAPVQQRPTPQPTPAQSRTSSQTAGQNGSFAVPGQTADQSPFAIPGQKASDQKPSSSAAAAGGQDKPMSLFYLLQHYSKENAAIYKNQKADKKQEQETEQKADKKSDKKADKKANKKEDKKESYQAAGTAAGFAVPNGNRPVSTASPVPHENTRSAESPVYQPEVSSVPYPAPTREAPTREVNFGGTVIMGDDEDGATVIMGGDGPEQRITPHLICLKNNENIPINKEIFRLGRDKEFNDYVITNNPTVGRSHCHILAKGGEYYIVDDNSKNHTYVDGTVIPSGYEVKISHAQRIRISNEEFEFRLF